MKQPGLRRSGEFVGEHTRLLRRNVEPKDFDGDEPVTCWLVSPEDRAERANADLMLACIAQVRNDLAAAMRQVASETVSEVVTDVMRETLIDQGNLVRDCVRETITQLLGDTGPVQPVEPPAPDFRMDMAAQATADEVLANAAKKARVDVVGLLNGQADVVRKACGNSFNLRFLTTQEALRSEITAPTTVLVTKFVGHDTQDRIRKSDTNIVYVNGAAESVVKALQELA